MHVRKNISLNGELMVKGEFLQFLGSHDVDGRSIKTDMSQIEIELCNVLGSIKCMIWYRPLRTKVKGGLDEEVIISTVLFVAKMWGKIETERRR